jgi:hypothetical protein
MRQQGVAARRSSKIDTRAGIKIAVPLACHYAGDGGISRAVSETTQPRSGPWHRSIRHFASR